MHDHLPVALRDWDRDLDRLLQGLVAPGRDQHHSAPAERSNLVRQGLRGSTGREHDSLCTRVVSEPHDLGLSILFHA